jgi:uncharacterized membrane protein YcaP (DUF421 family)
MNTGDNSILAGLLSSTTQILLNFLVGWLTFKSKKLEQFLEGRLEILIHNGKI